MPLPWARWLALGGAFVVLAACAGMAPRHAVDRAHRVIEQEGHVRQIAAARCRRRRRVIIREHTRLLDAPTVDVHRDRRFEELAIVTAKRR